MQGETEEEYPFLLRITPHWLSQLSNELRSTFMWWCQCLLVGTPSHRCCSFFLRHHEDLCYALILTLLDVLTDELFDKGNKSVEEVRVGVDEVSEGLRELPRRLSVEEVERDNEREVLR